MKNRNGFTLIELIVCFALVTVLTISLFKTVLAIQQKQAKNISYNSYLSFVSVLNNTIKNDFLKDAITNVESCGTNCYNITYRNKGVVRLQVDKTNNTITYDSNTEKLPTNYKFYKDISLTNHAAVSTSDLNSYYLLRLPIKSDFFPNMEDIKYMHQYNNENNNAEKYILNLDLNGGTLSGEYNNLLYSTGTVVALPVPIKENYTFKNWIKVNENNGTISGNDLIMGTNNVSLKAVYIFGVVNFSYTGNIQTFTVPIDGTYKLEAWGASGGNSSATHGGYGGYSQGEIYLTKDTILYIAVGGEGVTQSGGQNAVVAGGYNGGGNGFGGTDKTVGGGGGATHIATVSGTLSSLSSQKDKILIVAGGGGGAATQSGYQSIGGNGGGIQGAIGSGYTTPNSMGNQIKGGEGHVAGIFGAGGNVPYSSGTGGGGGYYGGAAGKFYNAGGGGSGYIGNTALTNKSMYCHECIENTQAETFTINTIGTNSLRDTVNCPNGYSTDPISKCAKAGNGYVKISYIES